MTREAKLYTQEKREKEIRQTKQRNPGNGMLFRVCVYEKKKNHYFVFSEVQDTLLLLSKKGFYKKREQAEDKKKALK